MRVKSQINIESRNSNISLKRVRNKITLIKNIFHGKKSIAIKFLKCHSFDDDDLFAKSFACEEYAYYTLSRKLRIFIKFFNSSYLAQVRKA